MNNLGIYTVADRERIADWVMHGNGKFYQRHEIQARIVRLLGSIAKEVEQEISTFQEFIHRDQQGCSLGQTPTEITPTEIGFPASVASDGHATGATNR